MKMCSAMPLIAHCAIFEALWEVDSVQALEFTHNRPSQPPRVWPLAENEKGREPIEVLGLCSIQTGRHTLRTRRQEQRRQQVLVLALVLEAPWLVQRWPLVEPM